MLHGSYCIDAAKRVFLSASLLCVCGGHTVVDTSTAQKINKESLAQSRRSKLGALKGLYTATSSAGLCTGRNSGDTICIQGLGFNISPYSITNHNIAIFKCIDIFLHP